MPYYNTDNAHKLPELRKDLFKEAGIRRGLSPAQRLQEKGKFVARIKNRIESGDFAKETILGVGVVSLSKNALSIPMWSHYANFHRGFIIEFRIPVMGYEEDIPLSNDRLLPFPVEYSPKRPRLSVGEPTPENIVNKVLLTKSTDWEYEEEERVIDHERGPGIYPYRRDEILCSVIAGMKMSDDNYAKLQEIINSISESCENDVHLFRAEEIQDDFKLQVPQHPRLGRT